MNDCRISDKVMVNRIPAVVLENAQLRVVVLTGKGTDIYEFRHKPSNIDVLWKTPWGAVAPSSYVAATPGAAAAFLDLYPGGWQELFPNAGASCTYKGAELGFHGEICTSPWSHRILDESTRRVAVKFWVRTVRTPFLVEKVLTVEDGRPILFVDETVTNEGAEPMDFMWGHHPAFGAPFISEHCRLFLRAEQVEVSHAIPGQALTPEACFPSFPIVTDAGGREFDLSRMLPRSARVASLTYLTMTEGWYCLANDRVGLGFSLLWDRDVFRYIWLWQEFCGTREYPWWGQAYLAGVEPHSSYPGLGLKKAMECGTQLRLEPGASLSTRLLASLFTPEGEPTGVGSEGQVQY